MISRLAFRDDTSKYLLLLATGTVVLVFISSFFLRVIPSSGYAALPSHEREGPAPRSLHRAKSSDSRHRLLDSTGTHQASIQDPNNAARHSSSSSDNEPDKIALVDEGESNPRGRGPEESSSLLSSSDLESRDKHQRSDEHHGHGLLDIRGFSLLPRLDFWQQFILMGLLTGIGLMTIKYVSCATLQTWNRQLICMAATLATIHELCGVTTMTRHQTASSRVARFYMFPTCHYAHFSED